MSTSIYLCTGLYKTGRKYKAVEIYSVYESKFILNNLNTINIHIYVYGILYINKLRYVLTVIHAFTLF